MVSTQNTDTPRPTPATMNATSDAMTSQRSQRRRLAEARFGRRAAATGCYYTGVSTPRPFTADPAAPSLPVDEQMARIRRGAAEIIAESELAAKLERSLRTATP